MVERDFQNLVIRLAEISGWSIYHVANVSGQLRSKSSVGFPDLLLVRDRVIVWECKIPPNKCTKAQVAWLNLFKGVGIEARMITPADYDYIKKTLSADAIGELRLGIIFDELKKGFKTTPRVKKRKKVK